MIYIHSKTEHSEKRRVIRNTWASRSILERNKAKLLFITGKVNDDNLQAFLETESKHYRDIIQGTFKDTYRNLTYKAITALKWVSTNCENAVFVLKTDDDVIVDINRLVSLLRSEIKPKFGIHNILAGYLWINTSVVREKGNKWYTTYSEYPEEFYLTYCAGLAYIMSSDVIKKFYFKSFEIPFFWIDDYFVTGLLADASNVTHVSLNDRYIVRNSDDIRKELNNDLNTKVLVIHSPSTEISLYIWHSYNEREQKSENREQSKQKSLKSA